MNIKVTHIATTMAGGAGIGLQRYHQAMLGAGIDSRIVVRDPPKTQSDRVDVAHRLPSPPVQRLLRRLKLTIAPWERFRKEIEYLDHSTNSPTCQNYELFSSPWSPFAPELHPWVKEADVINLHFIAGFIDWPRFGASINKPVVLTLHDQSHYMGGFHYAEDALANPHLAAWEMKLKSIKKRALTGKPLAVISNSQWNETAARSSNFFDQSVPFSSVYYPLDDSIYQPRSRSAARETLGIKDGHLVIGFACEDLTNVRKGFDALINCLTQLPADLLSQVSLLSFGRPPSSNLRSQVTFPWSHLGSLETDYVKVAVYAAMDVFVAPSRAEAFGLTALEASSVGVPVVINPVGGLIEAVPPAQESLKMLSADSSIEDRLLSQLVPLLRNPELRMKRGKMGQELAKSRHSPANIGAQLRDFYLQLLP